MTSTIDRDHTIKRPRWALLAVLSLSVGLIACSNDNGASTSRSATDSAAATADNTSDAPTSATPPPSPDEPGTTAPDDGRVPGASDALSAAGVQVVELESDLTSVSSPLILTRVQSDRLLADVGPTSGIAGSTLDELAPLPPDVPPMSYFVAAWVTTADSVAASTARGWMGDRDWVHAPQVLFPEAVVALFVQDMAAHIDASATPESDAADPDTVVLDVTGLLAPGAGASGFRSSGGPRPLAAPQSPAVLDGPCTAVLNFVGTTFAAIVNALHITPISGGGIFGSIGNFFIGLFNAAIGLASGLIQGLVKVITAPVFNLLRIGIGALAIATVFASFFRDTKVDVTLDPTQSQGGYRFAVGAGSDIKGQFIARSRSLTGEWPASLIDCAGAVGVPLPTATGEGAPATWTINQGAPVISADSLEGKVGADLTARLKFTTGRESDEQAKGEPVNGTAFVKVRIPRKAVEDLLQLGRDQIIAAKQSLLAVIPIAVARDLVNQVLSSIIDPTLNRLQAEIAGAAAGLFTLSGIGLVTVDFHKPPDTTTTAPTTTQPTTEPPTSEPDDFCTQYAALVDFAATHTPDPVVPWAQEIVRRLEAMRPIAPSEVLADVDVELGVYRAVAVSADIQTLIVAALPLGDAAAHVGAFCGLTPRSG